MASQTLMKHRRELIAPMRELLESKNQTELFERLARYKCEPPLQIRIVVAGSQEPVTSIAAAKSPFPLRIRNLADFSVAQFNYASADTRLQGTVFFCPSSHPHITFVISICSSAVWNRSIRRLVTSMYPKLVPIFLTQSELFGLLRQTRAAFDGAEFLVIGHSRKQSLKTGSRRPFESSRTRTEKTLETVFAEATEQNYWYSSLTFDVRRTASADKQQLFTTATVSKYGHVFCTSQFDRFFYGTVSKMAELAEQKMRFFSNRARRTTRAFEAKPISITFESPEFTSREDTNTFVGIMKKMTGASCSVLHANPYIHLSVVDDRDGSAADLWVLKSDEIILVPQVRASEAALKKVVNYIFEEWREGSISSSTSSDELQQSEA